MTNVITDWLRKRYEEEKPLAFYRELFPLGALASYSDQKDKYNSVLVRVWKDAGGRERAERHLVFDSLGDIESALSVDPFMDGVTDLCSPVSYAGRRPMLNKAHELFALVFDLDGITIDNGEPVGLSDLVFQMSKTKNRQELIPMPTYIVSSGTGLHLYYMLDEPIRMWPNVCERLQLFRDSFTKKCWNRYVTDYHDKPQLESVVQAFRMVGSRSKSGDQIVRAFRTGDRVSIGYMNTFVPRECRLDERVTKANLTIEEARERWPEWDPDWRKKASKASSDQWAIKRDLFDWWCRRVESGEPFEGNRYWCIFMAACYAAKCPEVTYEELEEWALSVRGKLDDLTERPGNEFTVDDVMAALGAYANPQSVRIKPQTIANRTQLPMPDNKRNYQDIRTHLRGSVWVVDGKKKANICAANRDIALIDARENGRVGRHDVSIAVRGFALNHPGYSHSRIARELGVSRPTVIKWLKPGWEGEYKRSLDAEARSRDSIREFAAENKSMNRSDIARALGIPRSEVFKWLQPGWEKDWGEERKARREEALEAFGRYFSAIVGSGTPSTDAIAPYVREYRDDFFRMQDDLDAMIYMDERSPGSQDYDAYLALPRSEE